MAIINLARERIFVVIPRVLGGLQLSLPAFDKLTDHFAQLTGNIG